MPAAVPDHLVITKSDRAAVDAGCWFDQSAADRVIRFVERYVVPTRGPSADKPVTLLPWQRDLLGTLFGWKKADGRRRFRFGSLFIPRQNGKSFIATCIALYMLVADGEPGSYCVISAVTGYQTGIVYNEVLNSVRQSPALLEVLKPRPSTREIEYPKKNGMLKGLSNEGWGKLGNPPHCAVMDEFCFWKDYKPYEALKTGMDSRRQPLLFGISTSGHDRTSEGFELWEYARGIKAGTIVDPNFFPVLFAADAEDDIHDPAVWQKSNPSLGLTVGVEETAAWSARAKLSKREELQFRQYRLNLWVSSVNQFLDLDSFIRGHVPHDQWPDLSGHDAFVGIDMAQTRDLVSVVSVTPHGGKYYAEHHSFCCRAAVEKNEAQNLVKYTLFEADGSLTVHDGNIIDFEDVRVYLRELAKRRTVRTFAFDPREASDTILILKAEGYPAEQYPAGPLYFDGPMRRLEAWVNDGKLVHDGKPILLWQAQNLESKVDHREYLAPQKPRGDNAAKIDTMYALLIAIAKTILGEAQNQAEASGGATSFAVL
jgi:phage terminase large subunit-like protein